MKSRKIPLHNIEWGTGAWKLSILPQRTGFCVSGIRTRTLNGARGKVEFLKCRQPYLEYSSICFNCNSTYHTTTMVIQKDTLLTRTITN